MSIATVKLVETATAESLQDPDWGVNIALIDRVNANGIHARDAMKTLKKRLTVRHPAVQMLSLTLLDALMRNCFAAIEYVDRKGFQKVMKTLATEKGTSYLVRNKVLELLKLWGEAYLNTPHLFPAARIFETYQSLKKHEVAFPDASDSNPVPPYAPPSRLKATARPSPSRSTPSRSSSGPYPSPVLSFYPAPAPVAVSGGVGRVGPSPYPYPPPKPPAHQSPQGER